MVNIKHRAQTVFLKAQALFRSNVDCFRRKISVLAGSVDYLVRGKSRSRRAAFLTEEKNRRSVRSNQSNVPVDLRRRTFLKYAAFGGVVFLAGKYFSPLMNTVRGDAVLSEKTFDNFKMVETGRKLQISDDEGNEILTIDKEGF